MIDISTMQQHGTVKWAVCCCVGKYLYLCLYLSICFCICELVFVFVYLFLYLCICVTLHGRVERAVLCCRRKYLTRRPFLLLPLPASLTSREIAGFFNWGEEVPTLNLRKKVFFYIFTWEVKYICSCSYWGLLRLYCVERYSPPSTWTSPYHPIK